MVSNFFTLRADDHADINARGLPTDADAALAHGAQSICSSFRCNALEADRAPDRRVVLCLIARASANPPEGKRP